MTWKRIGIIMSMIGILPVLPCLFLQFGCEFFDFTLGVIIMSIAFCSVYVYALALYWKAVYSFKAFYRMLDGIQVWTEVTLLISLILSFLTAHSHDESMSIFEVGRSDFVNRAKAYSLTYDDENKMIAIGRNILVYSISFTFYSAGQMLVLKQKIWIK